MSQIQIHRRGQKGLISQTKQPENGVNARRGGRRKTRRGMVWKQARVVDGGVDAESESFSSQTIDCRFSRPRSQVILRSLGFFLVPVGLFFVLHSRQCF